MKLCIQSKDDMKKVFKYVLIIAACASAVWCLSKLQELINPDALDPNPSGTTVYSILSKHIHDGWKQRGQWDYEFYLKMCDDIRRGQMQGLTRANQYELQISNNILAVDAIQKVFDAEMQKSKPDEIRIQNNKSGLDSIGVRYTEPMNGDIAFTQRKEYTDAFKMYSDYEKIMNYTKRTFVVYPKLDVNLKWTNFSAYRNSWEGERKRLQEGEYYASHFSKIDVVKDAWASFPEKVSCAEINYYNSLFRLLSQKLPERINPLKTAVDDLCIKAAEAKKDVRDGAPNNTKNLNYIIVQCSSLQEQADSLKDILLDVQERVGKETPKNETFNTQLSTYIINVRGFINRLQEAKNF